MDQSLAAAFDVDVIGGLSRLAGSALGSSTGKKKNSNPTLIVYSHFGRLRHAKE